jgi:acyl dehydratase
MNEYRWSDLSIGLKHSFDASFTAQDTAAFAKLSGDTNPQHTDEEYAKSAAFTGPVLFGMLVASLYSQLAGVYLPGKFALLQGMNVDFNSPCYAGDRLTCAGEIVFMNKAYQRFEIEATTRKQDRELVSKALIRVGFHAN